MRVQLFVLLILLLSHGITDGSYISLGCPLKKLVASSGEIDAESFERNFRERIPVIMQNVTGHWRAHTAWASPSQLIDLYGDVEVSLRHQLQYNEQPFYSSIKDYLTQDSLRNYVNIGIDNLTLFRRLRHDYAPLPRVLRRMHKIPFFSLGRNATGTGAHKHEENWVAQLFGRKYWIMAPPQESPPNTQRLPCSLLQDSRDWPKSSIQCVTNPGDVFYLPSDWHHATCNLDSYTLAVGGMLDSKHWPHYLHLVQEGDTSALAAEFRKSGDVKFHGDYGIAALHMAAREGPKEVIDLLLQHRVDSSARQPNGHQALHTSALHGSVEVLQHLIRNDLASIGDRDSIDQQQALHLAVSSAHTAAARWLIMERADIHSGDSTGMRPLHIACATGMSDLVLLLLEHRAKVGDVDNDGQDARAWSVAYQHVEILDLLVEQGTRLDEEIGPVNGLRPQLLHFAADQGHTELVDYILDKKASIDVEDARKMRPLHWAIDAGHLHLLQHLVRSRADTQIFESSLPLELAQGTGHSQIVSFLKKLDMRQRAERMDL